MRADLSRFLVSVTVFGCLAAACAKKEETEAIAVTKVEALESETAGERIVTEEIKKDPLEAKTNNAPTEVSTNSADLPLAERITATNDSPKKMPDYPAQGIYEEARVLLRARSSEKARDEALVLMRRAAEAGNPLAQHVLAVTYLAGMGVPRNVEEGLAWLNKSAAAGYAEAQFKLASLYMRGDVVPADEAKALDFALKAAEQGHGEAQYNLATIYATGKGVPKDMTTAAEWFRKAAEGGHATAQSNLGVLYASGEAVEKNPAEALKWWRKAAEQGQPSAQFNLGQVLLEGKSAPKDLVEAYKWFSLAAEQGDRDARRTRDALAVELEPADVGEALKRAREFKTQLRAKVIEEREQL